MSDIAIMAAQARATLPDLNAAGSAGRSAALKAIAQAVMDEAAAIVQANSADREMAKDNGVAQPLIDRLHIDEERIRSIAAGVLEIAQQQDPLEAADPAGERTRPSGIRIQKRRTPLGVIGMIYESRPNVTVDAAALCIRSGNAILLRGGSEALQSNTILGRVIAQALRSQSFPMDCVQVVQTADRQVVDQMLNAHGHIDLLIPRGGASLTAKVAKEARVPVLCHLDGICHMYVDASADLDKALAGALNGKLFRPAVCCATECLLVHAAVADDFVPKLTQEMQAQGGNSSWL